MRVAALTFALVGLAAVPAAADDAGEFESKPNAFYVHFGLGTPLGYVGFEAERKLSPIFSLSAGGGFGLTGPQIALMPRAVLGQGRSALVLGAGLSRGKYTSNNHCYDDDSCARVTGTPTWVNAEIGGVYRWPGGLSFRYFGGYGHSVAGDLACEGAALDQCAAGLDQGVSTIYTGFAFGQAF